MNILCKIGIHDWEETGSVINEEWTCRRCNNKCFARGLWFRKY